MYVQGESLKTNANLRIVGFLNSPITRERGVVVYQLAFKLAEFLPSLLCIAGVYLTGRWAWRCARRIKDAHGKQKLLALSGGVLSGALCLLFLAFLSGSIYAAFFMGSGRTVTASNDSEFKIDSALDAIVAKSATRIKAEEGDAEAQHELGSMYRSGKGEPRNDVEAAKWELKAAQQGHPEAQRIIGAMYSLGNGVPQDYESAYAWESLAAANGDESAVRLRDMVATRLNSEALLRAQRLSRKLVAH